MPMTFIVRILAAAAMVLASEQAHATVFTTTNSTAFMTLGNNASTGVVADQVNWGLFDQSLGHMPYDDQTIQNNAWMTTPQGETVSVQSGNGGSFTTFVEGQANWQGDFANGTTILYTSSSSITLSFSTALVGIGVDAQIEDTGDFSVTLNAYDAAGDLLESFTNNGVSTGTGPNGVGGGGPGGDANEGTAPFVGLATDSIQSNVASTGISYVTITAAGTNGDGFAIDTSLVYHYAIESDPPALAPEPGTLGLLGAGLAGLAFFRRRARA
jgi:hypothetical protein